MMQVLMDSEDWDPGAYDAAMQSAFGEDYYQVSLKGLKRVVAGFQTCDHGLLREAVLYVRLPALAAGRR
jgi:KRI1-like family